MLKIFLTSRRGMRSRKRNREMEVRNNSNDRRGISEKGGINDEVKKLYYLSLFLPLIHAHIFTHMLVSIPSPRLTSFPRRVKRRETVLLRNRDLIVTCLLTHAYTQNKCMYIYIGICIGHTFLRLRLLPPDDRLLAIVARSKSFDAL